MEAARQLLASANLQPDDYVSIVQFDDGSEVVAEGQAGQDRERLLAGIDGLERYSGGTQMGKGLRVAVEALGRVDNTARKVLLLTDGLAVDEGDCREPPVRWRSCRPRSSPWASARSTTKTFSANCATSARAAPTISGT
jgi:Mg-chelatase subunit ChlD